MTSPVPLVHGGVPLFAFTVDRPYWHLTLAAPCLADRLDACDRESDPPGPRLRPEQVWLAYTEATVDGLPERDRRLILELVADLRAREAS